MYILLCFITCLGIKIDQKIILKQFKKQVKKSYTGKKRGRKSKSFNPPLTIAEYEAAKASNQLIQQQQGNIVTQGTDQPVKMLNSSKKLHTLILNRNNEQQQVYKMEVKR